MELNDFEAGKSITRAIGRRGPSKSQLFWAQIAFASLVAISGPEKVSISRAHPILMALVMHFACLKIIT